MNLMWLFLIAVLPQFIGQKFVEILYVKKNKIKRKYFFFYKLEYRDGFTIRSKDIMKFSDCITTEILVRNGSNIIKKKK